MHVICICNRHRARHTQMHTPRLSRHAQPFKLQHRHDGFCLDGANLNAQAPCGLTKHMVSQVFARPRGNETIQCACQVLALTTNLLAVSCSTGVPDCSHLLHAALTSELAIRQHCWGTGRGEAGDGSVAWAPPRLAHTCPATQAIIYLRHGPGRACPPTRLTPCRFMGTPFVLAFLRFRAHSLVLCTLSGKAAEYSGLLAHRAGVRDPSNMRSGTVTQWHSCSASVEHGVSRLIESMGSTEHKSFARWAQKCVALALLPNLVNIYIYIYIYINTDIYI